MARSVRNMSKAMQMFFNKKKVNSSSFLSIKSLIAINTILLLFTSFKYLGDKNSIINSNVIAATLELTKSVSNNTPLSGETFSYTLQYRCASITDNCNGAYITDPLPPEVEFVSLVNSSHISNSSYNPSTHTVTFTFVDPLLSGTSGQVEIVVRFPNGNTPNGTIASNTASIDATNATQQFSNNVIATASAIDRMVTDKFYEGGVLDNEMAFGIKVCNNQHQAAIENGTINPSFITVRDTLHPNATYISNDEGGIYDPVSHSIVWTYNDTLELGDCWWPQVFVQFSSADYSIGDSENNTAYVTYTPVGGSPITNEVSTNVWFTAPITRGNLIKSVNATTRMPGEYNSYQIRYWNASNVYIDGFYIEDIIPSGVIVDNFNTGNFYVNGTYTTIEKDIKYITNLNATWTSTPGSPFNLWDDFVLNVSSFGLAANEYITGLRWEFGPDPMPYSSGFNSTGYINVNFHVDNSTPPGFITNCVTGGGVDSSFLVVDASSNPNCATFEVLPGITGFVPDTRKDYLGKSCNCWTYFGAGDYFTPGDTLSFRIRAGNYNTSSTNIVNPSIADFLPTGLTYIPGSWAMDDNGLGAPNPTFTLQNNYNGTSRELLKWEWSGFNLLPTQDVYITFDAILGVDAPPGEDALINEYAMLQNDGNGCNSSSGGSEKADVDDLDGDGNITEFLCFSYAAMDVSSVVSIESEMLIKGQLDSNWTKFPNFGTTVSGGISDYILEIRNLGNVPVDSVIIIDILPFVGDQGVIDPSNRNSRWRPNLVSTVTAPPGVTVYYSTESNPCRDSEGIVPSGPSGCSTPNWTTSPPDLSAVQSLKFDMGSTVINALDTLRLQWAMRAPVSVLSTIGAQPDSISWNSFGFIAQRLDNGDTLLATEPVKVGMKVLPVSPNVFGDFVWSDIDQDGIQDSGEPGIDGVRVELYKDNGDWSRDIGVDTFINFTLTNNGGYYLFPNLSDGNYYAVFYRPNAYEISPNDLGGNDALDSDGTNQLINGYTTAITPITNLSFMEIDLDWDQGFYPSPNGAIGNYVWEDVNGDGIQNESASDGINNYWIYLYDNASPGVILDSVATSNDIYGNPGYFTFDNIPPGNYFLETKLPSGLTITTQGSTGNSDPLDSDFGIGTNRTEVFTISAGVADATWDLGLILPAVEICDNGFDDDGDGYADCFDVECPCYAPFTCEDDLYQIFQVAGDYILNNVEYDPVAFNFMANLTDLGLPNHINALAYNTLDNFIYGLDFVAPYEFYRVNALGQSQYLGNISGLSGWVYAGGMDNNGNYYVLGSSHDLYLIDINTLNATFIGDIGYSLSDIAINPLDGMLYGWNETVQQLMVVNPIDASTSFIGPVQTQWGEMGAIYFNSQGKLYGYGDDRNVDPWAQEALVEIDINTGLITAIGSNSTVQNNDGCSCAFGISLEKTTSVDTICLSGEGVTYTFSINNQTGSNLSNITFEDVLPTGLIWDSEPKNKSGVTINSTSITGTSSANFTIQNVDIGSNHTFEIDVISNASLTIGTKNNQAKLTNIPSKFGIEILSDDPTTLSIIDPTSIDIIGCVEICDNGIDDDNDGYIDNFDSDCSCEDFSEGEFYNNCVTCEAALPLGNCFDIQIDFSTQDALEGGGSVQNYTMSYIGDMDNDGEFEIVGKSDDELSIYVFNGKTGQLEWTVPNGPNTAGGHNDFCIGDIDGDGNGEVYFSNPTNVLGYEFNGSGFTQKFNLAHGLPTSSPERHRNHVPQLADFNEDGVPELFIGSKIFNANTGVALSYGGDTNNFGRAHSTHITGSHSVAVDILPDAFCTNCSGLELVIGDQIFSVDIATGMMTVEVNSNISGIQDGKTSVADIDGDGDLEVIFTKHASSPRFHVYDALTGNNLITNGNQYDLTNGNIIGTGFSYVRFSNTGGAKISQPNIIDIDDDGLLEFVFVSSNKLICLENDFTLKWYKDVVDVSSGFTTTSSFDLNGDKFPEVLYGSEDSLYIINGVTGATLESVQRNSGSSYEYPTVADVDQDGATEILISSGNKILVFESACQAWMPARGVINQIGYYGMNVNDNLTIPQYQQPHHIEFPSGSGERPFNGFLNQMGFYDDNGEIFAPAPNMIAALDSVGTMEGTNNWCGDSITIYLTLTNSGMLNMGPEVPISIYDGNPTLVPANLLKTIKTTTTLLPGIGDEKIETNIPVSAGLTDLYVVVNDKGFASVDLPYSFAIPDFPNTQWSECSYEVLPVNFGCSIELCDDGFDNDGDGDTDCVDSDCIPEANPASLNTCDNSNETGTGVFFLYNANLIVSTESGVAISYHSNILDAQNDVNVLISPYSSMDGTIYARVERIATGCYNTSIITLNVGSKCSENCNNGIDDDGDGLVDCDDPDCPCCKADSPALNGINKN